MTEPRTYPEGVTSWVDTEQDDVDAAADFYSGLFGWTFTEATPPGVPFRYRHRPARRAGRRWARRPCDTRGEDAGGAGGGAARWNTYVAVDDADAATSRVEQAGGAVVRAADGGRRGRPVGVVRDPQGLELRLWEARRRLGAQVINVPGAWNFSDLHTDEPEAAQRSTRRAFGWEFADVGFATMIRVPGYGDHLASTVDPDIHERQAGGRAPPGFADAIGWVVPVAPGAEPGWHVTFTVADATRRPSVSCGSAGPSSRTGDSDWTRTAVVRDPQGAVFTASQFLG